MVHIDFGRRLRRAAAALSAAALCTALLVIAPVASAAAATADAVTPETTTQSPCEKALPKYGSWCRSVQAYGHRGREYPAATTNENTLIALQNDANLHAGCETDTWPLEDSLGHPNKGRLVILHDQTVDRVASAASMRAAHIAPNTLIGTIKYSQFSVLRTKGGQPLPTLQEWIQYASARHVPCDIEIKWHVDPDQASSWIKAYGGTAYISFYIVQNPAHNCDVASELGPLRARGIRVGIKADVHCPLTPAQMAKAGYSYITAAPSRLTPAFVHSMQQAGIQAGNKSDSSVTVWEQLVRSHVNFIIAPDPGVLTHWLRG